MSPFHLLGFLLISLPAMGADPESDRIANKLVGAWRLVSIEGKSASIPLDYDHPSGLIVYTSSGWMSVQISVRQDRKPFAKGVAAGTMQEKAAAFSDYLSYYGTYTVDAKAQTVTHHLKDHSHPNQRDAENVRWFDLQGDNRIVLTPREDGKGGVLDRKKATYKLTWERSK